MAEVGQPALWTAEEICAATGGRLLGDGFAASGVDIDSRSLGPGDLFIALKVDRDGHAFVADALARGAAGALVDRGSAKSGVLVGDTSAALIDLGRAARSRAGQARRGAVTGSVGKTSVTQAVLTGLQLAGKAHGSVHPFNNHIGVPLTLARMPAATERAIFEIGMNHPGEIAPLSRQVAPHAVAVTTVEAVHVENFEDGVAGVAKAKAEIFEGLQPGGIAILNRDNAWFDTLAVAARDRRAEVRAFGAHDAADARLCGFTAGPEGSEVEAVIRGRRVRYLLQHSAAHWGLMSLCALLMLGALEVDLDAAIQALRAFGPLTGRGATHAIPLSNGGEFTLIDESYNASPVSVTAALANLAGRRDAGRRIVVLTDMLELGADSADRHAAIAARMQEAGVAAVFCAGPLMKHLYDALPQGLRGAWTPVAGDLLPPLTEAIGAGDVVMVKGSKASRAWAIAKALLAQGEA